MEKSVKCACGKNIERNQYFAESDEDFAERARIGRCRSKCKRVYPVKSVRERPPLDDMISANCGAVDLVPQAKEMPIRDLARLAFARSMSCCKCGAIEGIQAHHDQEEGKGTMSGKTSDRRTVPLCPVCHHKRHAKGRSFWGVLDIEAVISQINEAFDNR